MSFEKNPINKQVLAMAMTQQTDQECKECGNEMVQLIVIEKVICPLCAHRRMKEEEEKQIEKWTEQSWKAETWNYFDSHSVLKQKDIKQAGFKNYNTSEEQVAKAKMKAINFIKDVLDGGTPHMILSGEPGTGKSHLAMATLKSILEMSKYTRKGIYVHYSAFLKLKQKSFDDTSPTKEIKRQVASIEKAMEDSDLIVLDDLGVDLGSIENPKEATAWNMDTLNQIMEAREDKALIITTNFGESQIKNCYGARNYSRIFKHSKGYRIEFTGVKDKRLM